MVPKLYKEIREAEIASRLQINNDNFHMDGFPVSPNVKLRFICYLMSTNKFSKELVKTTHFWNEQFLNTVINFRAVWKGCKIPYIDGYSRSIHYLLVHKALYTRSRLSHFLYLV